MVKITEPPRIDPFGFFVLILMVYFQVRMILQPYLVKFHACIAADETNLNEIHKAKEQVSEMQRRSRITLAESLKRLEALEAKFNDIVVAESALLKVTTADLREQLESGAHWGKKRQELQAQVGNAMKREAAWAKALEN